MRKVIQVIFRMCALHLPTTPVRTQIGGSFPLQQPIRRRGADWRLASLVLVMAASFLHPNAAASPPVTEVRRVLILNVMGPLSSPGVARMDEAIVAGLEKSPYQMELYSEDLEATLFPDEVSQREFRERIVHKYRDRKLDVIVAVGFEPLRFMIESHESFFPNTPIVFCGSTEEMLGGLKLDSHFTGVWTVAQPEKTLKAALALQPGTRHVVVVGGVGVYDRYLEAIARESFRKYESSLEFTYLTDLSMPALVERLKHLPDHTIVYHTSIMQDADGTRFIDASQAVPIVASAARAPVFVVDDVDLGKGTVGGDLVSFAAIGEVAARMAVRVLNGENPQDIPVVKSGNAYIFDWRALKRWGLKERELPPGSVVLNRQSTVWELYKSYIIGGMGLFLLQTLLIVALVRQRARGRKAETELAITYDRFRQAVEAGKTLGWDWDVKTGRDHWFGDLRSIFGIESDSYSGRVEDFHRLIHPEDRAMVGKAVADARQNRKPYFAEFRVVRPDGVVRWITARGQFHYDANGDAERMLGMSADITERKQAEESLKKSEEKFSTAFRQSPLALAVTRVKDDRYLDINETYEKMTGWRRDEIIGRTPFNLNLWVHPDQRTELAKEIQAKGTVQNLEFRFRCKDGELRDGLGSAEFIEIDGEPCLMTVVADITERKQSEEALRASEQRLRLAVQTGRMYTSEWDAVSDTVVRSPEYVDILGTDEPAQIARLEIADRIHRDDRDRVAAEHASMTPDNPIATTRYRFLRHDGTTIWLEMRTRAFFDGKGKKQRMVSVMADITERKQAEQSLRESEERFRLVANTAPVLIWMSGSNGLCHLLQSALVGVYRAVA